MLSKSSQFIGLAAWLAVTFIAASIGAAASVQAASFYAQLIQPEWAPSAFVFGPVWTLLFILMAFSAWLVWRQGGARNAKTALLLFAFQLAVNALWSWLFFAWQLGVMALADVILLWGLIVLTMREFLRHSKVAVILLIPYLLWVTFAAVLNYRLWQLNPSLLG